MSPRRTDSAPTTIALGVGVAIGAAGCCCDPQAVAKSPTSSPPAMSPREERCIDPCSPLTASVDFTRRWRIMQVAELAPGQVGRQRPGTYPVHGPHLAPPHDGRVQPMADVLPASYPIVLATERPLTSSRFWAIPII